MKVNHLAIFLLLIFSSIVSVKAQVKSPDEFLPHKIGEDFTPHHLLVDYMYHVAENSDNVVISEYGKTNQGRPLLHLVVSSEENIVNIENIRLNNLFRAGLKGGKSFPEWDHVSIIWLGFSVHGNEPSGSESSMPVIYELVRAGNLRTKEWLKNTVVLIDPSINPDGYSRYTHWNRNVGGKTPNDKSIDREHNEPWPGGRVNHYLFDLNRDWAWQTQIESEQRMKVFNKWLPQVHVDFHEMYYNEPYYFAPAAAPYHEYITEWQGSFQYEVGKNHAKYFDKEGWLYFTREVFDLLYPSYGDSYPTFNGAIGMTYEQGGHSRAGRAIMMDNGEILKLEDRVNHHFTTALSSIEVTSINADQLIKEFKNFYSKPAPGKYKSYLIKGENADKVRDLARLLDKQDIEYVWVKSGNGGSAYSYRMGKVDKYVISEGDLLIQANQPKKTLLQVLLDPEVMVEDSLTYDITAWSLPYAYGLEAFASTAIINAEPIMNIEQFIPDPTENFYAIILDWNALDAVNIVAQLHKKEVTMRLASVPFTIEGKDFPRSSIIITKADNKNNANDLIKIIGECGANADDYRIVNTGFSDSGADLGSEKMKLIKSPEVLVLSGDEVSPNSFGEVWYYFEQVADYPVTVIDSKSFGRADIDEYNVLVLTDGSYGFSDEEFSKIRDWVSNGGKLINLGYSNISFQDREGFGLAQYATDEEKQEANKLVEEKELLDRFHTYEGADRRSVSNNVPGAIFEVSLDPSHPLAYGLGDKYFTLKTSGIHFPPLKGAWNVGIINEDARSIGFTGSEIKKDILGSVNFAVEDIGRGSVVYLLDNLLFRGFWKEGQLLFSNAVFLVW